MRKVNEALRHVLADGVESLGDPGLGFVTVTAVRASPDLGHAEVYISVLGSKKRRTSSLRALDRAHGVLQGRVARELHLKRTPQLSFHYDETLDQAMRLNEIMAQDPPAPVEPDPEITKVYAKFPAPVGHRQPSVRDVERAKSGTENKSIIGRQSADDLNQRAREIEGDLCERLTICREC